MRVALVESQAQNANPFEVARAESAAKATLSTAGALLTEAMSKTDAGRAGIQAAMVKPEERGKLVLEARATIAQARDSLSMIIDALREM